MTTLLLLTTHVSIAVIAWWAGRRYQQNRLQPIDSGYDAYDHPDFVELRQRLLDVYQVREDLGIDDSLGALHIPCPRCGFSVQHGRDCWQCGYGPREVVT